MPKKQDKKTDFESALTELDSIVETMEGGELTLESSLEAFERGIKLTRHCQKALKDAEQKVEILIKANGNEKLESYKSDDEE